MAVDSALNKSAQKDSDSKKTYLDEIIKDQYKRPRSESIDEIALKNIATRGFREAISKPNMSIIAEVKRASPSKGDLSVELDAKATAETYEKNGAAAISVLTNVKYFKAKPNDLADVKGACRLPILRKDFLVNESDVLESKQMGADAILLIVAACEDKIAKLYKLATELNLDVLVEVHDANDIKKIRSLDIEIIGVNQRDLYRFEIIDNRAIELYKDLPKDCIKVAESGITTKQQLRELADIGYNAALIGSHLVTNEAHALRDLVDFVKEI
jgi:indole-3-glycerol phosphate synthase